MERSWNGKCYLVVVFEFLILGLCTGCEVKRKLPETLPTPVTVAVVEEYTGKEGVTYSASIVPYVQVSLSFKSAGYVTSILQRTGADGRSRNVQQGDWVKKDEVLATVRQEDYRHVADQYKGQLEQTQANAENAKQNFERAKALYAANALTQPDYDSAKAQYESSQGAVTTAQASLAQAQQSLADCELRVPINCQVLSRNVEIGMLVASGTAGFTVGDTRRVKAIFGIPDTILGSIHSGKKQGVFTETYSQEFIGQITAISPQADQKSRTFQVEVTLPNPKDLLKAGMVVTLDMGQAKLSSPVLVIPLNSIVSPSDGTNTFNIFVVTHEGDKEVAKRRMVQPGQAFGNKVAITKGAALGERIISNGATLVSDGQVVQIIP
jgi:RND family efflux transporter MFP subunit